MNAKGNEQEENEEKGKGTHTSQFVPNELAKSVFCVYVSCSCCCAENRFIFEFKYIFSFFEKLTARKVWDDFE